MINPADVARASADFDQRIIGLGQVGAGAALALVGFLLATGIGRTVTRTAIKIARVIR